MSNSVHAIVRECYAAIGVPRDDLPYTPQFDNLHWNICGRTDQSSTKHQTWRLLGRVLKKGGAPRTGMGTPAPTLAGQQESVLREVMPGPVSERDRWPYTPEFDQACDDFRDLADVSWSNHELWRAVCNLGKAGGGTSHPSAQMGPLQEGLDEYREGKRLTAERRFFARNAQLVRNAKEHYGYVCKACGFDFEAKYGDLGSRYIECHHLDPLSERPEEEWTEAIRTSIDRVTVVCANCHRMIHRQSPGISLDDLREAMAMTAKG